MIKMVEEQAIPQLSKEEQTASIQEITATAKKLGALAEELKDIRYILSAMAEGL